MEIFLWYIICQAILNAITIKIYYEEWKKTKFIGYLRLAGRIKY